LGESCERATTTVRQKHTERMANKRVFIRGSLRCKRLVLGTFCMAGRRS
jgi:hypothetical protein